eukprot:Lankesteria_metandrocarpae@DN488_c0_g1_i3.p1
MVTQSPDGTQVSPDSFDVDGSQDSAIDLDTDPRPDSEIFPDDDGHINKAATKLEALSVTAIPTNTTISVLHSEVHRITELSDHIPPTVHPPRIDPFAAAFPPMYSALI